MTTKPGSWRPLSRSTMVAAGMPRDEREGDAESERTSAAVRVSVEGWRSDGDCGPEKHGGDRAPGAGAGLEIAGAEEGGDGPGPAGFLWSFRVWTGESREELISVHPSLRRVVAEAAEVFEDFGVEDGELIL